MANDHYQTLGLDYSAGTDDIRLAFRTLAATCHPDRNPGAKAKEQFLRIRAAYDVLIDPQTRAAYLDGLRHAVQEGRPDDLAAAVWNLYLDQMIEDPCHAK
ncbi:MAG: J domain-containing protein [Acidithiobacillus sp.]|uniref:J domain-containing protein n=1 Tax=Acidithiobacillus ferrooxidans TaxID=920 RepID=UPI000A94CB98|nr:DnaJ domain-containing protein [Acidithiobacillus ferrooxidans]